MAKSEEIKSTDGRKNNSKKKSIPILKPPIGERSNVPALNTAKKNRRKLYAKKAIKNIFGSEVALFETMAQKAKEGSYNHLKLLTDLAYEETKDERIVNNAPTINFFNSNDIQKKVEDKIIDITNKIDNGIKD
jgi:hypothetical protein